MNAKKLKFWQTFGVDFSWQKMWSLTQKVESSLSSLTRGTRQKGELTTAQTMVSLSLTFITVVGSTWLWPFYYLYLDHNFNPPTPADVIIMGFLFYLVTFFLADLVSVRQLWYTDQRHHVIIHSNPSVTSFEFLSPKINIITLLFFSSRILSEINKPNSIFNSSRKTKMQTTSTDLFTMIRWRFQNLDNI